MINKIAFTLVLLGLLILIEEEAFWAASEGLWAIPLPMSLLTVGFGIGGLKAIWSNR